MKKCIPIILILLVFLCSSYGVVECERTTKAYNIPCRQPISYKPGDSCTNYNVTVYNATNQTEQILQLQDGIPQCYFIFNITTIGYYPWNSSLEWGNITVIGGDEMASFTIIMFLLVFNLILFFIPFKLQFRLAEGIKGEILSYLIKRAIWMISIWFFYYIFLMVAQIGVNQNLGMNEAIYGLIDIFTFSLYITLAWFAFMMIIIPIKMYKSYQKIKRTGDFLD